MGLGGRLRGRTVSALAGLLGCLTIALALGPSAAAGPALYVPPLCRTVTYRTEPQLYPQSACMDVGVRTHQTERGTYLFLTTGNAGFGIFKDNGGLIWWNPRPAGTTEEHDAEVVHLYGRSFLAVWAGTAQAYGTNHAYVNSGTVLLYNHHYQQVGEIGAGAPFAPNRIDMHEFRITPQGDALVGIYVPVKVKVDGHREIVLNYVIQKLSLVRDSHGIHTGKVLFQWSALKHVGLAKSYSGNPGPDGAWDYFHGNAIDQDTDGNLIVSARDTWGIYKISVKTGRIIWQVGGRGDQQLRLPWCFQHDVSALGHHEYSLFDDGAAGMDCMPGTTWHASRGLIFRVDRVRGRWRLTLLHSYRHHPAIHTEYLGSMERLADGNVVIGWGTVPQITEFSANGKHVLMDLSLSRQSFRGFRFAWVGRPLAPPLVTAKASGPNTNVWASWNGSTQTVFWRLLAGPTATTLTPVGGYVRRAGFETRIVLKGRPRYLAVEALGAARQVLGTSQPLSTLGG